MEASRNLLASIQVYGVYLPKNSPSSRKCLGTRRTLVTFQAQIDDTFGLQDPVAVSHALTQPQVLLHF